MALANIITQLQTLALDAQQRFVDENTRMDAAFREGRFEAFLPTLHPDYDQRNNNSDAGPSGPATTGDGSRQPSVGASSDSPMDGV